MTSGSVSTESTFGHELERIDLDLVGPEPISLADALAHYVERCLPHKEIRRIPLWRAKLIAFMTGNRTLGYTVEK